MPEKPSEYTKIQHSQINIAKNALLEYHLTSCRYECTNNIKSSLVQLRAAFHGVVVPDSNPSIPTKSSVGSMEQIKDVRHHNFKGANKYAILIKKRKKKERYMAVIESVSTREIN